MTGQYLPHDSGYNDAHVQQCVDDTWIWRNIFVAETDAEAKRIAAATPKGAQTVALAARPDLTSPAPALAGPSSSTPFCAGLAGLPSSTKEDPSRAH